ncbi:MAG TPA: hypothetical protein VF086_02485 [Propionibacteriaceae bacterium]
MHAAAVELDVVVPGESVGKSVRASGGVLAAKPLLLGDLHLVVHVGLTGVEFASFVAAEGDSRQLHSAGSDAIGSYRRG